MPCWLEELEALLVDGLPLDSEPLLPLALAWLGEELLEGVLLEGELLGDD